MGDTSLIAHAIRELLIRKMLSLVVLCDWTLRQEKEQSSTDLFWLVFRAFVVLDF